MVRRNAHGHLALLLAITGLIAWNHMAGELAFAKEPAKLKDANELQSELMKVSQPWTQPHKLRVSHGGLDLSSVSQGPDQWQLVLAESGDGAGVLATKSGGNVAFGAEYDSAKSKHRPSIDGLRRVAASAASKESGDDVDWNLRLESDRGTHFSAAGDSSDFIYDASLGYEAAVAKGVSARLAMDLKRREGADNLLPNWVRGSAGLRYDSPAGKLKVNLLQADPDASNNQLSYDAQLEGDVTGPFAYGSPHYVLRATDGAYAAKVKVAGPKGLSGGAQLKLKDGKASVSGHGDYEATHSVGNGIELGVDAKVTAASDESEILSLQPIGLTASADLSKLVPSIADKGSSLDLRARYKLGAERPALTVGTTLNNKRLAALNLAAEAAVDDSGTASSKVSVRGSLQRLNARYEASRAGGNTKHVAEATFPVALKQGSANVVGRLWQSDQEHGGKPRVQLGLNYDGDVNVGSRQLHLQGESAAYDSGSQLLGDDGLPWSSVRLNRIRNTASTLRKRMESAEGEGYMWLRK